MKAVSYTHLDVYKRQGIYVAESHGIGLSRQLSAYGQVGGLAEEVLAEIHSAFPCLWNIV